MFTIGFALLVAKYFEKPLGDKAAAAKVGAIAGFVLDITIGMTILGLW